LVALGGCVRLPGLVRSAVAGSTIDLADEPEGTDFEIDAGTSAYRAAVGSTVFFRARAFNAKRPVTYLWDFGDGSRGEQGESVKHTYTRPGMIRTSVVATDASGARDGVQLILRLDTPAEHSDPHGPNGGDHALPSK
jgi:hypothetical protein